MQINDRYLNTFKRQFADMATLAAEEPTEVPLSGFEKGGDPCISTDIPAEEPRAAQLDIIYRDTNPDDAMHYELVGEEAEANRQTFVIPRRDGNDIDTVGYLFTGLLHHQDARLWYRAKFGYEQGEQQSDDDASGQA